MATIFNLKKELDTKEIILMGDRRVELNLAQQNPFLFQDGRPFQLHASR